MVRQKNAIDKTSGFFGKTVVSIQVFLTGLATDFCVGGTALDALSDRVGVQAVVVTDAVSGVDEVHAYWE